jgi:hypothetical protein
MTFDNLALLAVATLHLVVGVVCLAVAVALLTLPPQEVQHWLLFVFDGVMGVINLLLAARSINDLFARPQAGSASREVD